MKLHRDAAPTIPAEAMAYYQTPPTERSTWRADLARIGVVSGITFVIGVFATGTAVIFWRSWQTVGVGAWLTGLAIVGYLAWHAWNIHSDLAARKQLDLARMRAEQDALTVQAVDLNQDGQADAAELEQFVNYVRRLHRGEASTAAHAQQSMGVAGPDWQEYRDWLVKNGYANIVARRGGSGFALKPSALRTPWPKLEKALRQRLQAGLRADGLSIRDASPPDYSDAVSTLGRD